MDALHMVLMPASARATASKAGYCKVCAKMLGTAEGVRRLCVMPGYRHLNKHECKKSADRGCPLCGIILRGGWEAERFRPIVLPSQPGTSGLRRESELKRKKNPSLFTSFQGGLTADGNHRTLIPMLITRGKTKSARATETWNGWMEQFFHIKQTPQEQHGVIIFR